MTFHAGLTQCRLCPRLVEWRERKATTEKRAAFAEQVYWGRPVPSFGPIEAPILIVGLAPAAHGANRTGRMFTGDRSGEWVYRTLHRVGLATSPDHEDPALELRSARITAVCHCAPPDNKPTSSEVATCVSTWLVPEVEAAFDLEVIVCLGGLSWDRIMRSAPNWGWEVPRPRPRFGHGAEVRLGEGPIILASYHPSQQNTFTGKLTEEMFEAVFRRAVELTRPPSM